MCTQFPTASKIAKMNLLGTLRVSIYVLTLKIETKVV